MKHDETLNYLSKPRRTKRPPTPAQLRSYRWPIAVPVIIALSAAVLDFWTRRLDPVESSDDLVALWLLAFACAGAFGMTLFVWAVRVYSHDEKWRTRGVAAVWALCPVVIFISACVLDFYGIPFRIAFAITRPALERAALAVRADPAKGKNPGTIRMLPIETIVVEGATFRVHVQGADDFDLSNFLVWSPGGPPPVTAGVALKPLGHDWYHKRL